MMIINQLLDKCLPCSGDGGVSFPSLPRPPGRKSWLLSDPLHLAEVTYEHLLASVCPWQHCSHQPMHTAPSPSLPAARSTPWNPAVSACLLTLLSDGDRAGYPRARACHDNSNRTRRGFLGATIPSGGESCCPPEQTQFWLLRCRIPITLVRWIF